MSINVLWGTPEKTILIFSAGEERWRWSELYACIEEGMNMMDEVSHQVDIVVDLSRNNSPPDGNILKNFRHVWQFTSGHVNFGRLVFVNGDFFIRTLITTFMRIYGTRSSRTVHFADTLDEAYTYLSMNGSSPSPSTGDSPATV